MSDFEYDDGDDYADDYFEFGDAFSNLYTTATPSTTSAPPTTTTAPSKPKTKSKNAPATSSTNVAPPKPKTNAKMTSATSAASSAVPASGTTLTSTSNIIQPVPGAPGMPGAIAKILEEAANIITAVSEGKSVTSVNKKKIVDCARLIIDATRSISSLTSTPSTQTNQISTQTIREVVREEMVRVLKQAPPPPPAPQKSGGGMVSYASVAAKQPEKTQLKTKPAIIVSPKEKVNNNAEVVDAWKRSISFRETNFAPVRAIPLSNHKLRVEFETTEQQTQVLAKIVNSTTVSAEPAKKLKPMLLLKGINSSDTKPHEIVDIIKSQNQSIKNLITSPEDLSYRFKRQSKNPHLYDAVMWTTPKIWRALIDQKSIFVDHQRVQVQEFVPLKQCFKCLQYGHTISRCPGEFLACSHCAQKGHTYRDCPNKNANPKCLNCTEHNLRLKTNKPVDHTATSKFCPINKFMLSKVIDRTDYGS